MTSTFDVQFWDIKKRTDGRSKPYRVRWRAGDRDHEDYFRTKALADGFRSGLLRAARAGELFEIESGLPESTVRKNNAKSWYEHARAYSEMKWPAAAAKTRRSMSEALTTVTVAMVSTTRGAPEAAVLRMALFNWAYNPGSRGKDVPADVEAALAWIADASVPITSLSEPTVIRKALDACTRTLDGKAAAATTARRKRTVLYNALGYAIEQGHLESNPIDRVQWKAQEVAGTVDRRVVVNPEQVTRLLAAVHAQGDRGRHLVAFYACMYYAGMRPAEVLALQEHSCVLPTTGWGRLDLTNSAPRAGADWTDDGSPRDQRGLKRRGQKETRTVPIPPELVVLLRGHLEDWGAAPDGRLFRSGRGGAIQDSVYSSVWRVARIAALTEAQAASPLARRPYDLRHAAVSLWLNAGVPATEVARRAGHGVAVMLAVYANCVDGHEQVNNDRISRALTASSGPE